MANTTKRSQGTMMRFISSAKWLCFTFAMIMCLLHLSIDSIKQNSNNKVWLSIKEEDSITANGNILISNIHAPEINLLNISRINFLESAFHRVYISDKCKFIYFMTYKTASYTTRKMIDIKQCGFGIGLIRNAKYSKSCADHKCDKGDYEKFTSSQYFRMMFIRNPINRFESIYNYIYHMYPKSIQKLKIPLMKNANTVLINASNSEMQYFQFVEYYYSLSINHHLNKLDYILRGHLQQIMFYLCMYDNDNDKIICPIPSFVGKVEYLMHDIRWIDNNKKLGRNISIHPSIYNATHSTMINRIKHGLTYKHNESVLLLCQLYWYDFHCGDYDIPSLCKHDNLKKWHFHETCVGLDGNTMIWPQPQRTST